MTELRKRMIEGLQVARAVRAPSVPRRTHKARLRSGAAGQLAQHYHKSPDLITEERAAPVFPLSQECQTPLPQHRDHRHLRAQNRKMPSACPGEPHVGSYRKRELGIEDATTLCGGDSRLLLSSQWPLTLSSKSEASPGKPVASSEFL